MKRVVLAGVSALAAISSLSPASAADLTRRMPAQAPAYVAPHYNWTGFYAGINGGGGFGHSDWSNLLGTAGFDTSGGLVGGTVGYNYEMNRVVFGVEGDLDYSTIKGDTNTGICVGIVCETRNQWLGTARGRIGYAFDRLLPYLTAGGAFGDVKMTPSAFASETETRVGWTAGGGLEFGIAGPWSAKLEYLYVDLGKANCSLTICGTPTDVDFNANVVRAGINYRF